MSDPSLRHALVLGAGLAGAAVCAALVRRGWRVSLLDAASGPAQGASALPVGMLSPHVTRAPTPLSRLSTLGVAQTRAELQRLLPPGQGWQPCEVDNRGHDPGRWPAALVRPSALVHAWLDEAAQSGRLTTHWNARVDRLIAQQTNDATAWQALDSQGRLLAQAPHAVVAAAFDSLALLLEGGGVHPLGLTPQALPLRPVKGQMSLGALVGPPLAPRPQRDKGVFVPLYEDSGLPPAWPVRLWAMGSTYNRGDNSTSLHESDHLSNLESLRALHPQAAEQMRAAMTQGALLGWAQVRCASLDRLPLVGRLPDVPALQRRMGEAGHRRSRLGLGDTPRIPGLYMLSALGSRGLTLAHWCAEQLAQNMDGEESEPAFADLMEALDPARFAWRQVRKHGQNTPA